MSVSIRDVAQRAGVSISTASRALNNKPDVNKEVRQRVLAAARELNYAANVHARVLGGGRSRALGLVIVNSADFFFTNIVRGVSDTATAHGYSIMVWNTDETVEGELWAHQMLRQRQVDGALIGSVQSGMVPLERLIAEGLPIVLLNRRLSGLAADHVLSDYRCGAYDATRYLIELGHRRIAHLTWHDDRYSVQERLAGYLDALRDAGIEPPPDFIIRCAVGMEGAYRGILNRLPELRPKPTALFVYNDYSTIGVLKAFHELDVRVPDDISLMGYDDMEFSRFLIPSLTTMAQNPYEIGRQGTELLIERLRDRDAPWTPRQIVLRPELRVRASTTPPGSDDE